ncbi:hypothetical protein SK3146_06267 [Paenibacillus konkukensis]|uniref:Uncharacterized protein n=1 Tax=Paenibacillus konkukensis TaxID=2020716 RepID=A0ABY4RZ47_9BACL|nr:hypothetical protein [Paenibacillus konkukensis]UQZ86974.1 hypothetical protein SK3146_06267 [Paenibacillus konkukensis]
MQAGYVLVDDHDFETAQKMGCPVKATQGGMDIYPPGKVTGFSSDHVTISGKNGSKRLFRSVNRFEVVEAAAAAQE